MNDEQHASAPSEASRGSLLTYISGFTMSVVLTLVAYIAVTHQSLAHSTLIAVILVLAVAQFVVQMVFFLHLGAGSKARWNLIAFSFMLIVLGILVFGTLWIMRNLDYHMNDPNAHMTDQEIIQDEGVYPQ